MGQGIQDFYNAAKSHGFSRDYQLRVAQIGDLFQPPHDNLFVYAKTATVPTRTLVTNPVMLKGFRFNVTMAVEYSNSWKMTLYCDEAYTIRTELELWQKRCFDEHTMTGRMGKEMIQLNLLNDMTDTVMIYRLHGCAPKDIGELTYNLGGNGVPQSFDIEFAYQYWTSENVMIRNIEDQTMLERITGIIRGVGGIAQKVNNVIKGVKTTRSILGI